MFTQREIILPGPLLDSRGRLAQAGWARQPLLDCNLEAVRFYPSLLRPLQRVRIKRWDYYGVISWRDDGEVIQIDELVGFVAQHHVRW